MLTFLPDVRMNLMKNSSPARTTYDTTPATHGDLDIWGGRIMEVIDEKAEEVKTELRAEIKQSTKELRTEFSRRMDKQDERLDNIEEQLSQVKDTVTDNTLLLKAIDKKLSKG